MTVLMMMIMMTDDVGRVLYVSDTRTLHGALPVISRYDRMNMAGRKCPLTP